MTFACAWQSKRGQRSAGPSVVPIISGKQLPEHALDSAPGRVLNSCRAIAKDLDPTVTAVRDADMATGIKHYTSGVDELSRPRAIAAPLGAVGGRQLAPCCGRKQGPDYDEWNHDALSHGDLLVEIGKPSYRRCLPAAGPRMSRVMAGRPTPPV